MFFTVGSGLFLYDSLYSPLLILSDDQVLASPQLSQLAAHVAIRPKASQLPRWFWYIKKILNALYTAKVANPVSKVWHGATESGL
jgi:hypothetical protein